MTGMESTATVSTDLDAVTDLVLQRQLIDVQRDHAKGIVKMVLECAAEAAGPVEPAYKPATRRINVTVESVSLLQLGNAFYDHVSYLTGWDGGPARRSSAFTPPSNSEEPTALSRELAGMVGRDVALWVTDDEFFTMPTIIRFNDLGVAS